jgi:cytoskeletal protein CcmA (bactofilin family)
MIRMGRNSKPEDPMKPEAPPIDLTKNNQNYGYAPAAAAVAPVENGNAAAPRQNGYESVQTHGRAMTDSESMARDIKEGRLSCFVGNGTTLTGETNFKAMLRVDGHLTGKILSESGTLIVGTSGQIDANIMVAAAVVHGTINGDIIATERLELGRTAKVIGNIQAPSLVMEQGAVLEGNCSMIKQRAEVDKRKDKPSYNNNSAYNLREQSEPEAAIETAAATTPVAEAETLAAS